MTDYYRAQGVEVLPGASVTAIERVGDKVVVATGEGRMLEADSVVAGLGIEPRVELAVDAGLPVADGVLVDDRGRVDAHARVFAAGDVARYPEAALGGARRVRRRGSREEPR